MRSVPDSEREAEGEGYGNLLDIDLICRGIGGRGLGPKHAGNSAAWPIGGQQGEDGAGEGGTGGQELMCRKQIWFMGRFRREEVHSPGCRPPQKGLMRSDLVPY